MSEEDTASLKSEHDKLEELGDRPQTVGEFLEWLQGSKHIVLAKYGDDKTTLLPDYTSTELLLSEFFDIDLDRLEKEKLEMLAAMRDVLMPTWDPGTRVLAISHASPKENKVYVFGAGELLGDKNPERDNLPSPSGGFLGETNPCIRLDDGKIVWGCECWWSPEDAANRRFEGFERIHIDIEERRKEVEKGTTNGEGDA